MSKIDLKSFGFNKISTNIWETPWQSGGNFRLEKRGKLYSLLSISSRDHLSNDEDIIFVDIKEEIIEIVLENYFKRLSTASQKVIKK